MSVQCDGGVVILWKRRTTSQTGHFIPLCPSPRLPLPPTHTSLTLIMPSIASFSKLCGHFWLVTGSLIASSVIGHLMLIRSDATARSSSSSSMGSSAPAAAERVFGIVGSGDSDGNQVDA